MRHSVCILFFRNASFRKICFMIKICYDTLLNHFSAVKNLKFYYGKIT